MEFKQYENKVVMVVGCAQGIGKAVSEGFARESCLLAMFDIREAVHDTAKQIETKCGVCGIYSGRVDISSYDSCEQAAKETIAEFGRIDVLAVVSGILPLRGNRY